MTKTNSSLLILFVAGLVFLSWYFSAKYEDQENRFVQNCNSTNLIDNPMQEFCTCLFEQFRENASYAEMEKFISMQGQMARDLSLEEQLSWRRQYFSDDDFTRIISGDDGSCIPEPQSLDFYQ